MSRIPRPLMSTGAVLLALSPAAAVGAVPGTSTLVSSPPGFGTAGSPFVNHSSVGANAVSGVASRVVGDAQGNRFVAFTSSADGLSAEDDDRFENVYVRDRDTGRTLLVSRANGPAGAAANGSSSDPAVSPDGQFVAFTSSATNLTSDSVSGLVQHVYVRDILAGTTILVDRATGADGAVGDDGANKPSVTRVAGVLRVAFVSGATNLVNPPLPANPPLQIYVREGTNTELVSAENGSSTATGNGISTQPSISADGTRVAFTSAATDLTAQIDDNLSDDVFVRVLGTTTTKFVTQANAGIGDADSYAPSANTDGTRVAFSSSATNFSNADDDGAQDVFVWDDNLPDASDILLVSRATGASGAGGDEDSGEPSIDGTGELVAFSSLAANLVSGDTNQAADVFLRSGIFQASPATSRPSRVGPPGTGEYDAASANPSVAQNGDYVAFTTTASNAGDTDDDDFSQVYGRPLGLTIAGPQHLSRPDGTAAFRSGVNSSFLRPRQRNDEAVDAMSADGRYTVFLSEADDLVAGDLDTVTNVYRRDNLTGETILISRADGPDGAAADDTSAFSGIPTSANAPVGAPGISADGNRIVFASAATNLVAGDTNDRGDVFVRDVAAGRTIRASVSPAGAQLTSGGGDPAISGDGRRVAFSTSDALDGGDANNEADVHLRDLEAGTTVLVSRQGPAGPAGDESSGQAALDADGSHVAFTSSSTNLPDGGGNGVASDVFVRDVAAGQTILASRRNGSNGVIGNDFSSYPSLSDDGLRVAFASDADNLVPNDNNGGVGDVFVRDLTSGQTLLASRTDGANGVSPTGGSARASISADGTRVVFETNAPDLVAGDQNGLSDVALRDLTTNQTTVVSRAGGNGAFGNGFSGDPALSADGNCVAFTTTADNLAARPAGVDFETVVGVALRGDCPFGPLPSAPAPAPPAAAAPQATARDVTAPVVTGLRARPARFQTGRRIAAARKGRPAVGTAFTFRLSEAGRATLTISAALAGKRVRTRCVAPKPRLRGKACTRLVRRGALVAAGRAGANRIAFTGRIGRRSLAPGRYRASLVVRDAAGNASVARTAAFTILPKTSARRR